MVLHLHIGVEGQFAALPILQAFRSYIDVGKLDCVLVTCLVALDLANCGVGECYFSNVDLRWFSLLRRFWDFHFLRLMCLRLQQRVVIVCAIGIFHHQDCRRRHGKLLHVDIASQNVHEAVPSTQLIRREDRFVATRLNLQPAKNDFGKRTNGGVGHRYVCIHGRAYAGKYEPLKNCRAGSNEINNTQQHNKCGENPSENSEPTPTFWRG